MALRKTTIAVVLLLVAAADAAAQLEVAEGWYIEQYTSRDGLPVDSVTDLEWSDDGYLWLTTFDGLARFDGYRFQVFSSATDPALPSNRLTRIRADEAGNLWLATEQHALVRVSRDNTFTAIDRADGFPGSLLQCLERDSTGNLWICGDEGIARLRNGRVESVEAADGRDVDALLVDRRNRLWTAYPSAVELWENNRSSAEIPIRGIQVFFETSDGSVWAGAQGSLWRLSPGEPVRFAIEGSVVDLGEHHGSLLVNTGGGQFRLDGENLRRIVAEPYVRKSRGLTLTDSSGRAWVHSSRSVWLDERLILQSADGITTVVEGREGNLWLATEHGGLVRLRESTFLSIGGSEGLPFDAVYPVWSDQDGTLLVGSLQEGWARVDPESGVVTRNRSPGQAATFERDRSGALWIGGNGLCRVSGDSCVSPADLPEGGRLDGVRALYSDRSGVLWVGSADGLYRLDQRDRWTRFDAPDGSPIRFVRVIAETPSGALWFGTSHGGIYHLDGERVRHFTAREGLPSDLIRGILVDGNDAVWIATENLGLVHARLDRGHLRTVSIRSSHGLFDDSTHQILDDGIGRLWISSNRGIFWISRASLESFVAGKTSRVSSVFYDERHGLRNREANGGVQSAGTLDRRGRLWFPSQQGVVGIDPASIPLQSEPPPVRVEAIEAGGERLPLSYVTRIPDRKRDFRIDYSALSFTRPELVRFRYRLDGFNETWVDAENRRQAFYTNVPPGRYRFHVAASHDGHGWSEATAPFELVVDPELWETPAFRGVAALLLLSLIPITALLRTRRLQKQRRELERQVEVRTHELEVEKRKVEEQATALAELDRLKSRFFADVSHELRTPLTMIIGPLTDLLENDDPDPARHESLVTMRRNALRLLRLVNQILDLRRLEAGGLELQRAVGDLSPFVRRVCESFSSLAERAGLSLHFHPPGRLIPVSFDAEQMEKILGNLLSNAVKFTPRGGTIEVTLTTDEHAESGPRGTLAVTNSGSHLAPEELQRIFDRYYRGSSSTLQEGSGIGLALVRELVELHGWRVTAGSAEGGRTTFSILFDLDADGEIVVGREVSQSLAPVLLPSAAEEPLLPSRHRPLVLVVEDNPDVQNYIRSVLSSDYRVATASDGRSGLKKARDLIPDLIVADVMMPHMDGFQLVGEIRNDPMTEPIPLVLLTARATTDDEIAGFGVGADDYLAKPFSAKVLKARIRTILGRRTALRNRLLEELSSDSTAGTAQPSFDVRLRQLFEQHLGEMPPMSELAAQLAMSRSTFERHVRDTFDRSPRDLFRTWRLERAATLLRADEASITEIAHATGFRSLAHFSRMFRDHYGVAPSEWRSQNVAGGRASSPDSRRRPRRHDDDAPQ